MSTGYWKKDGQPKKKDEATKDVEGHISRIKNDDADTEGHISRVKNEEESDTEGHSFILDTEMNRALARQREKDIQRNLRSESKRPFFRRGR